MPTLQNKNALITGASRGIGRAIAIEFAKQGARVAVHFHRHQEAAEETWRGLSGDGHISLQADISQPSHRQDLIDTTIEKLGGLDILVNNAGIAINHDITRCDYQEWTEVWEKTLATNLRGPADLSFWAVKHMLQHNGGRIINITSRGAFRGETENPAYGAAKAGLNSFSQSMAKALAAHNIYVMAVAPGWVETDMAADILSDDEYRAAAAQSPTGRMARPAEIGRLVAFLGSGEVEHITGAIIDVNGASYLRS